MYNEETELMDTFLIDPEWICGRWIEDYRKLAMKHLGLSDNEEELVCYFMYDLQFGVFWDPAFNVIIDGDEFMLRDYEDLWDVLNVLASVDKDFASWRD